MPTRSKTAPKTTKKRPVRAFYTIGITGIFGSGKSSVGALLRVKGFPVIDTDLLAKEIILKNAHVHRALKKHFGNDIYDEHGALRRRELAQIVFADQEELKFLNSLIHPEVFKSLNVTVPKLVDQGHELIFIESALIYERGIDDMFDFIIVVSANKKQIFERISKSTSMSLSEIELRFANQFSNEEKTSRGDFVIKNDGTPAELENSTNFVVRLLQQMIAS